jgi:hypothetical protein
MDSKGMLRNGLMSRVQRKQDANYSKKCEDYGERLAERREKNTLGEMDEPIIPPVRKITKFFSRV